MVLEFPDIADNGERGLVIPAGTQAVLAKATEGHSFQDPSYDVFKSQAHNVGAVFSAYHWLWPGAESAQALNAFRVVGPHTDLMIDVENVVPGSLNSVNNIAAFVDAYRTLGGNVKRLYLPRWYWRDYMHSPDLSPLVQRGLLLVASDYTATVWPAAYGGFSTVWQWQFTNNAPFAGRRVDMNRVLCDLDTYMATLGIGGAGVMTDPLTATELSNAEKMVYGLFSNLDSVDIKWGDDPSATPTAYTNALKAYIDDQVAALAAKIDGLAGALGAVSKQLTSLVGGEVTVALTDQDRGLIQGFTATVNALEQHLK